MRQHYLKYKCKLILTSLLIVLKNAYLSSFFRLHSHHITPTKTINSTKGTTTATIIIVPLESPSLLDTSPGGLEPADVVGDVVKALFLLLSGIVIFTEGNEVVLYDSKIKKKPSDIVWSTIVIFASFGLVECVRDKSIIMHQRLRILPT